MFTEFIDFCKELFPSISPYTAEQAKRAMNQFEELHGDPPLVVNRSASELYQGDIYTEIPFLYVDENGDQVYAMRRAQLLSNTCDASRDEHLVFAAIHECDEFSKKPSDLAAIKKNQTFRLFYLPDRKTKDMLVDFSMITTMSREVFMSLIAQGKVQRVASLSQIGYYMFICKLTIFFMRPEDVQVNADRDTWSNGEELA